MYIWGFGGNPTTPNVGTPGFLGAGGVIMGKRFAPECTAGDGGVTIATLAALESRIKINGVVKCAGPSPPSPSPRLPDAPPPCAVCRVEEVQNVYADKRPGLHNWPHQGTEGKTPRAAQ